MHGPATHAAPQWPLTGRHTGATLEASLAVAVGSAISNHMGSCP